MSYARRIALALIACMALSACGLDSEWRYEEVNRIGSPDGMVDAVWVRGSGGATTGFVYSLFLVPKGLKFDKDASSFKRASFSADHFDDLKFEWRELKLLEIRYKQARIVQFSNYWNYWNPREPKADQKYVVELRLVPVTEGFALSEEDRRVK
jgi:hypothetical protein